MHVKTASRVYPDFKTCSGNRGNGNLEIMEILKTSNGFWIMNTSFYNNILTAFIFMIMLVISLPEVQAQDYRIAFAGSGASTTVDSVRVENLTTGTIVRLNGTDLLHLGTVSGIQDLNDTRKEEINFYPNPMPEYSVMHFRLPVSGSTLIEIRDISGKTICQKRETLSQGVHSYRISGMGKGIYLVSISSPGHVITGKLVSACPNSGKINIMREESIPAGGKTTDSKGTAEEVFMPFTAGDRLKITAISDKYRTVIVDSPEGDKTIVFTFIECTDGDGNNYPVVVLENEEGKNDGGKSGTGKGKPALMAENLKTTKFNDGTDIPEKRGSEWDTPGPAYCWYNNNRYYNENRYGALYNYAAFTSGKLCPAGWHAPADEEWNDLWDYLGGGNVGQKLKARWDTYWNDGGGTDEIGFGARGGGIRLGNNPYIDFDLQKEWCYFWCIGFTLGNEATSWSLRRRSIFGDDFARWTIHKYDGVSVRCIKD